MAALACVTKANLSIGDKDSIGPSARLIFSCILVTLNMAYINISPAYAREVQYYTTLSPIEPSEKGKESNPPLFRVIDGKKVDSEKSTEILFDRIGEYKVSFYYLLNEKVSASPISGVAIIVDTKLPYCPLIWAKMPPDITVGKRMVTRKAVLCILEPGLKCIYRFVTTKRILRMMIVIEYLSG